MSDVIAQRENISIPTYGVGEPEKNPGFFEKRVYQGSCGKIYPVPIDKTYRMRADPDPGDPYTDSNLLGIPKILCTPPP